MDKIKNVYNEKCSMYNLEDSLSDGRLTEPSDGKKYRLREAILYSKKLGRPLTDEEMT